jgi:hypothetical protein
MKKGKSCVIKGYKNLKCNYGTVDSKEFKSIYLNIQSWVNPIEFYENWDRPVSKFNREIKTFINDILDNTLFDSKFIVDLDLRTSGISVKKKSFMNLEITFFIKSNVEFKSPRIKQSMKFFVDNLNSTMFKKSDLFTFHLTKTDKSLKIEES